MKILYAYICDSCGYHFEDFFEYENQPIVCPQCCLPKLRRDYMAETKYMRPDWAPGINRSMGIKFSGRRDLFAKARGAGFGLYGHGGSVFNNSEKRFYGDEEYAEKTGRLQPVDQQYLNMLQEGIQGSPKEDSCDG